MAPAMSRYDALVLGGGIIGAAIAEELAQRGASVCVVERGTIGCEASTAAAGILSSQMDIPEPGPFFDLCQASHRAYPAWVRRIETASGIRAGYHRDGILYVALTAAQAKEMGRRAAWQRRMHLPVERWSAREAVRREPALSDRIHGAYVFPAEAQLDTVQLMLGLAQACRAAGVTIREQTAALGLLVSGRSVRGVQTTAGPIESSVVVSCLGSWSGNALPRLPRAPVVPARGQMLAFDAPRHLFRHVVMGEEAYGVQRRSGRLIVGSTVEFVGYERAVTLEGITRITHAFARLVRPEVLAECALRTTWAGLRPYSPDPILGRGSLEGLFTATGHFRHGILLAPITALAMADLILTGRSRIDVRPFAPPQALV
jgi:glycine oxidase